MAAWRSPNSIHNSVILAMVRAGYHPGFHQVAWVDSETGESNELRLEHRGEAEKFYHAFAAQGMMVRVGMEASGHAYWFERLLAELQFELWIGDAAEIRTKRVRKQKTDRQDAQLLLRLLLEDRFPRINNQVNECNGDFSPVVLIHFEDGHWLRSAASTFSSVSFSLCRPTVAATIVPLALRK